MDNTFQTFLDELRAFESGWDRDRYNDGRISDAQLNTWAGGSVQDQFPQYSSWGDLSDAEWKEMSYASTNTLGFVGYQFGEALLIDLGYYDDDVFFGNGASINTWDGSWTGKNGVTSFDQFKTEAVQEVAIREAFGHNLKIIQDGLARGGQTLDDFIGTTRTYVDNGQTVTVELTLTGIMAAAHLRGAFGTLNLLQNGSVSADEFGTSILRYIEQFGGFEAPSVTDAIAYFEDRLTGGEGFGSPSTPNTDTPNTDTGTGTDTGTADTDTGTGTPATGGGTGAGVSNDAITAANASHVIDWAYGQNTDVAGFDPASDTIFIAWISADLLEVTQTEAGVVFAIPSNNQTLTLNSVTLADLDLANIQALDASARAELASLITSNTGGDIVGDTGSGTGDADGDGDGGGHGDGDTDGGHGGNGHGGGHGGMTAVMTTITLTSGNQTVDAFNVAQDMVHIEAGITADRLQIFEESGDALGLTTRIVVLGEDGSTQSTTILLGVGLDDLNMSNFSIAEQSAQNEVATAVGVAITAPVNTDGYTVTYDSDGSNPVVVNGASDQGGVNYRVDANADDITGFDRSADQLDVGGTSVHGLIITKTPNGELAFDSPWSDAMQIVTGVQLADLTLDNFAIVGNEHLRQDVGGVMSWELGVGPREADTVYLRSHEYGVSEVVNNFDPSTMKLSFLYFGTRERLSVEDTDAGLMISSLPTGQSLTLTGVTKADLIPGLIEFHHDQVIEDNLEVPFGFDQDQVTLVSRAPLLTPEGPAGSSTDGEQVRLGDLTGAGGTSPDPVDPNPVDPVDPDPNPVDPVDPNPVAPVDPNPVAPVDPNPVDPDPVDPVDPTPPTSSTDVAGYDSFVFSDATSDTAEITWAWGKKSAISNFDLDADVIDLNSLMSGQVDVFEADGNLFFEVAGNGGNSTALIGIQAEDLSTSNLTAAGWNDVLNPASDFAQQLVELGFDFA